MSPSAVVPRPLPTSPPEPRVPDPDRLELGNGLRVVSVTRSRLPHVAMRLLLPAGSMGDTPGRYGLASLVGALLSEGSEDRSAIDIHTAIDGLGATLGVNVGHDFAEVDLGLLSETLEDGLRLAAEVVMKPVFPEREVERVRLETLDAIEARLDEPANLADDAATEAVFGTDHPYGRLPLGEVACLERITREELLEFHQQRYRPEGSVLLIAGDLRGVDLLDLLERTLGGWTGKAEDFRAAELPRLSPGAGQLRNVPVPDSAQAEIRVAGLGMERANSDWIPAAVANFILGGSTITGRLGANLREDKGWTYGVRAGFSAGVQPSGWMIETAVDASAADDAIYEIQRELDRMVAEEVSPEELQRAKEALVLSLPRAFETAGRVVSRLATLEAYGLPKDYWHQMPARVRAVDSTQVRSMAERYFAPRVLAKVVAGPAMGS